MADQQHVARPAVRSSTSNGSPDSAGSMVTWTPSGSHARWAVCSARSLGLLRQSSIVVPEARQREAGRVGLA